MRVRVKSAQVTERRINRKSDGKSFLFREQQGVVQVGEETRVISVGLADEQSPYAPGEYELTDGSFYVDRNGRLQLGRLSLKPVMASASSRQVG